MSFNLRATPCAELVNEINYLLATWHPSPAPGELELPPIKWLGLDVRHTEMGGDAGIVEFVARHRDSSGRAQRLHETSRFVRQDGRWFYIDGQMIEAE